MATRLARCIVADMTAPPGSLDEVRAIRDIEDRILAATAYIKRAEAKAAEARKLRDADVRALVAKHGPSEAARMAHLSLSTVKVIKGRP